MYIVVVGGGKVGYYLTKTLVNEGYEVLLIERDPGKVQTWSERFGAVLLQGDGCEVATLEKAGVARADVVVATTGHDEDNLVIAQLAQHRFQVPKVIARINNPKNEEIFRRLERYLHREPDEYYPQPHRRGDSAPPPHPSQYVAPRKHCRGRSGLWNAIHPW